MNVSSEPPIPESLAFKLHRATALVDRAADLFLRTRYDVSYSLFSVLLIVGSVKNQSQRAIADMLGVSRASITQRVSQLLDRGLIRAAPSPTDARVTHLSLTQSGGELLSAAWDAMESVEGGIDAGVDTASLMNELDTVIANAIHYIADLDLGSTE